jgi:hypothetical protein
MKKKIFHTQYSLDLTRKWILSLLARLGMMKEKFFRHSEFFGFHSKMNLIIFGSSWNNEKNFQFFLVEPKCIKFIFGSNRINSEYEKGNVLIIAYRTKGTINHFRVNSKYEKNSFFQLFQVLSKMLFLWFPTKAYTLRKNGLLLSFKSFVSSHQTIFRFSKIK